MIKLLNWLFYAASPKGSANISHPIHFIWIISLDLLKSFSKDFRVNSDLLEDDHSNHMLNLMFDVKTLPKKTNVFIKIDEFALKLMAIMI